MALTFSLRKIEISDPPNKMGMRRAPGSYIVAGCLKHRPAVGQEGRAQFRDQGIEKCGVCEMCKENERALGGGVIQSML